MNRYAHLNEPEEILDFHGRGSLTSGEIKRETEAFVRRCAGEGLRRVRIVTGKGLHSKGAPIVRPQVERSLKTLAAEGLVQRWQNETLRAGGEGALRVDL
jgi:DNA-nicking Smr family endonuclease